MDLGGAVSCESGYWKFEKWKWKKFSFTFCSRSEKWNENLIHSFREWKVKCKSLEIEIESEKWNENALRSRSRVKSEMKMPRDRDREVKFLENSREILENPEFFLIYPLCVFKCLLKLHTWVNANLYWLHLFEFLYCMFLICPQITYFTMNIQTRPRISCLKGCKATLTTFDLTFPRCVFQMCLQIYILKGCIVIKVALVKTLPTLYPTTIFFVLK